MTGISHKLAQRYLSAAADGLIRDNQRVILDAHLRDCASCRAEADELSALEARLQKNFQARWDASDGPSRNVMTTIQSRSRRIIMTNRINVGVKALGGIAALIMLFAALNYLFQRLQSPSSSNELASTASLPGYETNSGGLIAFVSMQDGGNREIFTMKADGSEVTNLTNNPATDESPAWSPDGTRIAFESDRSGDTDIYVMNADGSNVSRLTDDRGFEGRFSWSPDGQKIVYISSENSLNDTGQLMVMNSDGSNKISLTSEPGSFKILNWSPDGRTILFEDQTPTFPNDSRIHYAKVDAFFVGAGLVGTGILNRVHWENSEQYVFVNINGTYQEGYNFELVRYFASEPPYPQYNGYGPVLFSSGDPIVALFDKTYVVENRDSLTWLTYEGAPIPLQPWKFSERCAEPSTQGLEDSAHVISPDRQHAFVTILCRELVTWFYLENADGSQFVQLTNFSVANLSQNQVFDINWSPDGKYVTAIIADNAGTEDLYRFDIEKMLNDPTTEPVQLTTDGAMKYGVTWQPQPKEEPVIIKATEEKQTPTLLTFSLTVQEAEALAGFDVLEPTYLPEGHTFQGAGYDPQAQKVALKYGDNPSLGVIYIYQQRGNFPIDLTLPSHTTPAPVGDVIGEYFHGAWIYESGATTPRWDGSADYYALSWKKDGISFSVDFLGGETIPNINLKGLRDIAESLK